MWLAKQIQICIYRDGTLLANDPVPVLGAGLFQNKTLGPFTMTGDSDVILVCADCDGDVTESNEGNNCSQNVFEYPAIADIHVSTTGWWWEGNESSYNASGTPIQHAIDNASDGHTIIVDMGYTMRVLMLTRS